MALFESPEKVLPSYNQADLGDGAMISKAQLAAKEEHTRTIWQSLVREPHSVFWSLAVSSTVVMEGYDIVLVSSLFAQPAFTQRYGLLVGVAGYQIPAAWQSAFGIVPTIGALLGAFLNGWLVHRYGYRKVLLISLVVVTAFIFLLFFATSLSMLLLGLLLCGIPWGVFATMAPAYASEVCSLKLRGFLTVYVNLGWGIGELIAAGVLRGLASNTTEWAYRVPFALQWCFPLPIFAIIWFCPESPWWLTRQNQMTEAAQSIKRLTSRSSVDDPVDVLALIKHTNQIEYEGGKTTSYLDCFRGVDLRRTEIACMCFAAQIWCGTPLGGTPAYFFVQAGLPPSTAFSFSVGGLALACIGTVVTWGLMIRFGRRTLFVCGLGLLTSCLLIAGLVAATASGSTSTYVQAGLIVLWLLGYFTTVGPVCYAIVSETSAVRLRNKSVSLGRMTYYLSQIVGNVIEPYMINPGNANWRGKAALFWAGTSAVFLVWSFFRLPETKDRSFEEIDLLFKAKVPARQFSKMQVNPYTDVDQRVKQT